MEWAVDSGKKAEGGKQKAASRRQTESEGLVGRSHQTLCGGPSERG